MVRVCVTIISQQMLKPGLIRKCKTHIKLEFPNLVRLYELPCHHSLDHHDSFMELIISTTKSSKRLTSHTNCVPLTEDYTKTNR